MFDACDLHLGRGQVPQLVGISHDVDGFDHVVFDLESVGLNQPDRAAHDHLRHILKEYVTYYSQTRTHLGLDKDAPFPRPVAPLTAGRVIAIRQVGGLHHRYERAA
jgi:hypothetical protein